MEVEACRLAGVRLKSSAQKLGLKSQPRPGAAHKCAPEAPWQADMTSGNTTKADALCGHSGTVL